MTYTKPDTSDCLIILDGFGGAIRDMARETDNIQMKVLLNEILVPLMKKLPMIAKERKDLRAYKGNIINGIGIKIEVEFE